MKSFSADSCGTVVPLLFKMQCTILFIVAGNCFVQYFGPSGWHTVGSE